MKIIDSKLGKTYVRKNPEHKRYWDVLETRGGVLTGKVTFTGTLAEIRQALKYAILPPG